MNRSHLFIAAFALLTATQALADTSTTAVTVPTQRLIDHFVASYWGQYSGPSLGAPSNLTTNGDNLGNLDEDNYQNLDSTVTLGYKLRDELTLNANYRFLAMPVSVAPGGSHFLSSEAWVSLKSGKLVHVGEFNLSVDLRGIMPILHSDTITAGLRTTQIATYDVPKTRLSLGLYTYQRANIVKGNDDAASAQFDVSPFASYQLTPSLSATFWSDVVQWDYFANKSFSNRIADVALGVNWDITQNVSFNPSVNFYPTDMTVDKFTVGAILSATVL